MEITSSKNIDHNGHILARSLHNDGQRRSQYRISVTNEHRFEIRPLYAQRYLLLCLTMLAMLFDASLVWADILVTHSLSVDKNAAVWDATRARFLVTTRRTDRMWPSSVVIVNPETARVDDSLSIGDEPNSLAISSDGEYLYVGIDALGLVRRYRMSTRSIDLEILVGKDYLGYGARSLAVIPGNPRSFALTRITSSGSAGTMVEAAVYDDVAKRPSTVSHRTVSFSGQQTSLYFRPGDERLYAWIEGVIYAFAINASGLSIDRSAAGLIPYTPPVSWGGGLATDSWGYIVNLDQAAVIGRVALPREEVRCLCIPDPSGNGILAITNRTLTRYSLSTFRPLARQEISGDNLDYNYDSLQTWGPDGLAIFSFPEMRFAHISALPAVVDPPQPVPVQDSSGAIRLKMPSARLVYDAKRDFLYASVPSHGGVLGNSVVMLDPRTGQIVHSVPAGSEPGALAITDDGARLFVALQGGPLVSRINLETKATETSFTTQFPPQLQDEGDPALMIPADLLTVPGTPQSVVVFRRAYYNLSTDYPGSVVLYQDGRSAPQIVAQKIDITARAWGRLYASDSADAILAAFNVLSRLSITKDGVNLDRTLNYLPGPIAVSPGGLFAGDGTVYNTDASHRIGSFASSGVPVPFPDKNMVAYAGIDSFGRISVVTFDVATFRPLASILIEKTNGWPPVDAVRIGSNRLAVTNGDEIFLLPLSVLTPGPTPDGSTVEVSAGVYRVNLIANAIAAGPGNQLLVATSSINGTLGNSIVVFDPGKGGVLSSTFVGSEPAQLAVQPNGAFVYAALAGEARIGRVSLTNRARDLVFAADYSGGDTQTSVYDIATLAGGGLAVSYYEGQVAVFDDGKPRPAVDRNDDGFSEFSARYQLATDTSGNKLYGYNQWTTAFDIKRCAVSSDGVRGLSTARELTTGFRTEVRYAAGRLYSSTGDVIDPERSRRVGQFVHDDVNQPRGDYHTHGKHVLPDPDSGRVYFIAGGKLLAFDMASYALLGSMSLPPFIEPASLVKWSPDGLAFHTTSGELYVVRTSSIPLLPQPVPSPQTSLPTTPGVRLVDLQAQDLVYDPYHDLIYASTPNSEAALGDKIVAVDPGTGSILGPVSAGTNPRRLAISSDAQRLYYSTGFLNNGFKYQGEGVQSLDLTSGALSEKFADVSTGDYVTTIGDLLAIPGQSGSIAVVHNYFGSGTVRIYDEGLQRPKWISDPYSCASIQPGVTPNRLYCYGIDGLSRLALDADGVTKLDSSGPDFVGPSAGILFHDGLLYTGNGKVVDPESFKLIGMVPANGPVAVDGGLVFWLEGGTFTGQGSILTLRSFDVASLAPMESRKINVTATDVSRLIPCGRGRLAFRAGSEIYIVDLSGPPSSGRPSVNLSLANNGAATAITAGGGGATVTGYSTVLLSSGTAAYGTAVFSHRENGVTISEVGVPASPPTNSARIFVDYRTGVTIPGSAGTVDINTGIAAVNMGAGTATITFTLRNLDGQILTSGSGSLAAGAHLAKYLNELTEILSGFSIPSSFPASTSFGTLELTSNQPISVIALRLTTNQRGETLFASTPVVDLTRPTTNTPIYFPQLVDGGGYTTTVILMNTSGAMETGALHLYANDGSPLAVRQVDGAFGSSFSYSIPAGAAYVFQTDASSGDVNVGWLELIPANETATPAGAGIFQGSRGGTLVTESGIPSTTPVRHARIFVDTSSGHDTGLALANPGNVSLSVSLAAFQMNGSTPIGTSKGPVALGPKEHVAAFVDEQILGLPAGYRGVLDIVSDSPFVALTIRSLVNERGDFLLTTFPIADIDKPSPVPVIFPQIADGGGYTTEFFFLSAGSSGLVTIRFFGDGGDPIAIGK